MIEFEIEAGKLQHATSILRRIDEQGILHITSSGLMCRVVNPGNAFMVQVKVPCGTGVEASCKVGIDFRELLSAVKRADEKDVLGVHIDKHYVCIAQGMHLRYVQRLDLKQMKKVPKNLKLEQTTEITMHGGKFRDIIENAADVGDYLTISESPDGLTIFSRYDTNWTSYQYPVPERSITRKEPDKVQCIYTVEYLSAVAADIPTFVRVAWQFATECPCEIEYTRDGVDMSFTIAPRIEST